MLALILASALGVTAECKEGMRDDPVLIIRADKNHYIYFLPDEMKLCEKYATEFRSGRLNAVCGCKVLKDAGMRDRLRLRCAHRIRGKIHSRSVMWFYYYPELTKECKRVQRHLMFKAKP